MAFRLLAEGMVYSSERSLLSGEELSRLRSSLEGDSEILKYSYGVNDGHGRSCRMCLWNHPGKDITGMVSRCEKVAGTMEHVSKHQPWSAPKTKLHILGCSCLVAKYITTIQNLWWKKHTQAVHLCGIRTTGITISSRLKTNIAEWLQVLVSQRLSVSWHGYSIHSYWQVRWRKWLPEGASVLVLFFGFEFM